VAAAAAQQSEKLISAGSVLETSRALMAIMSPATGTRSSGNVRLQAQPGVEVSVPRNHFAFPVIKGDRRPELVLKVAEGPEDDQSWKVTDTPGDILLISNIGGERYNLPDGTPIVFDPPLTGIVTSPAANKPKVNVAFSGGLDRTGLGCVADMLMYEQLRVSPELGVDLRRSGITKFPAVILTWSDLQSADGVTVPQAGRGNRVGTRSTLYKSTFDITIMVSRADEDHARRHEGLAIMEFLMRLLTDRQSVDGLCVSNPSGVQILQTFRETALPQSLVQKFYIYHIIVAAELGLEQIDSRTFNDWLTAVVDVIKPQDPKLPNQGDFTVVDDMEVDLS
jgi:hypothetical protein